MVKDFIQNKLKTDDKWTTKALLLVYSHQTAEEKATEQTRFHNNVGFTGVDAEFLSKLATQFRNRNWLSPKQMSCLRKMMPKYWRQISDASDITKLNSMIERTLLQTSLNLENA